MNNQIQRRHFLAVGAAALSTIPVESARGYSANDTLNVACIGTGGRARRTLMPRLATIPNVRLAAVCDVWDGHLATGVELACKAVDLLNGAATVQLVELGDQILPRSKAFNREQAEKALKKRGVTVHLNTRVDSVTATSVILSGAQGSSQLDHDGLVWTAGSRPTIPEISPKLELHQGRLPVTESLRLQAYPDVLALGDIAVNPNADELSSWPHSAQTAIQQGQFAAKALKAKLQNSETNAFVFKDLGEMLSLGVGDASITGLGLTLAGPLAFKLRRLTYLARLPGLSLGLRAAGAWLVSP